MFEAIFNFFVAFCGEYWFIGSLVLIAVSLLCFGIWCAIKDESFFNYDNTTIALSCILVGAVWPFILSLVLVVAILLCPILIGKYVGKTLKWLRDKKRKEIENMNNIEKIINTKERNDYYD